MKAPEVFINGHRLCLAGVGDAGVVSAIVNWVGDPDKEEHFSLQIGGLDSRADEHLRWESPSISAGAEVLVRVVEAAAVDPPDVRIRYDKETCVDEYRQHLRECSGWLTPDERRQMLRELVAELQAPRSPNKALQQTGHANGGLASYNASSPREPAAELCRSAKSHSGCERFSLVPASDLQLVSASGWRQE